MPCPDKLRLSRISTVMLHKLTQSLTHSQCNERISTSRTLARRASCIESSLVKLLGCDAGELRVLVRLSLVQQLPMASLAGFAFNEHRNWCV